MLRRQFLECVAGSVLSAGLGTNVFAKTAKTLDIKSDNIFTICVADTPNKNNRIYPKEVLQAAIENLKNSAAPAEYRVSGQMGMHESTMMDLASFSHEAKNLRLEGNELKCEINTVNTPAGQILKNLINDNLVEFRLQGVGSCESKIINDKEVFVVGNSYNILQINAVPIGEGS